jgi:hypothetical protein
VVVYVSHENELVVMYVSYKCKPCSSSSAFFLGDAGVRVPLNNL